MLARASPRNPYVAMEERSSYVFSLLVVKRSQTMSKSSFCDGCSVQRFPVVEGRMGGGEVG